MFHLWVKAEPWFRMPRGERTGKGTEGLPGASHVLFLGLGPVPWPTEHSKRVKLGAYDVSTASICV